MHATITTDDPLPFKFYQTLMLVSLFVKGQRKCLCIVLWFLRSTSTWRTFQNVVSMILMINDKVCGIDFELLLLNLTCLVWELKDGNGKMLGLRT